MTTQRSIKRKLWKRGLFDWVPTYLPVGMHPTKGWGASSRKGKRSNRSTARVKNKG